MKEKRSCTSMDGMFGVESFGFACNQASLLQRPTQKRENICISGSHACRRKSKLRKKKRTVFPNYKKERKKESNLLLSYLCL